MTRQRNEGRFSIFQTDNSTRVAASNASNLLVRRAMRCVTAGARAPVMDLTDAFLAMKELLEEDLT
jgi:hypothetical protein